MSANDFDFLYGRWRVEHRHLDARLAGSTRWLEGIGTDIITPAFAGLGNIGCFRRVVDGRPYEGRPIRRYDSDLKRWSIYWIDSFACRMEPPVHGGFAENNGEFIGDDVLRGSPIKVRYRWSELHSGSPLWEQAYSPDDGATWEVNSTMRFIRDDEIPDDPPFDYGAAK